MIVDDSRVNSINSAIIDYHGPFDLGLSRALLRECPLLKRASAVLCICVTCFHDERNEANSSTFKTGAFWPE